jgi:transcriptional regulator with XRE-family HTH domain
MKSPNPLDAEIGARLRLRRVALRMSQGDLGEALDIGRQQVQKYESGVNGLRASQSHHIAQTIEQISAILLPGQIPSIAMRRGLFALECTLLATSTAQNRTTAQNG